MFNNYKWGPLVTVVRKESQPHSEGGGMRNATDVGDAIRRGVQWGSVSVGKGVKET
jgi:hypothetical protein